MSQYIPPTAFHCVTGTWTYTAGQVAGTISKHKASNSETTVINIPIKLPSNSVGLKGSYLKSVEVDYELSGAAATSVTASLNKVTRGADTAVAVVSAVTVTQDLAAGSAAATQDQHKLTVTLTSPAWISNNEYYLLVLTIVASTAVIDMLGAVANYTLRV
jgi:CheY-specific phosphatase CheX